MNAPKTAKLHPRTARLMRELSGPDLCEQTRRDHEEVAEILRRARMERSLAVATYVAALITGVANAVRGLFGFESMGSSAS